MQIFITLAATQLSVLKKSSEVQPHLGQRKTFFIGFMGLNDSGKSKNSPMLGTVNGI